VALALALAYGEISNGLGTWTYFTDQQEIADDLEHLEDLAAGLRGSDPDDMDSGMSILADNLRRLRLRMESAKNLDLMAQAYRVETGVSAKVA
jgi:hypothetical protein